MHRSQLVSLLWSERRWNRCQAPLKSEAARTGSRTCMKRRETIRTCKLRLFHTGLSLRIFCHSCSYTIKKCAFCSYSFSCCNLVWIQCSVRHAHYNIIEARKMLRPAFWKNPFIYRCGRFPTKLAFHTLCVRGGVELIRNFTHEDKFPVCFLPSGFRGPEVWLISGGPRSKSATGPLHEVPGVLKWSCSVTVKPCTYVFSGLAMVQVLIFGGRTYFRGVW